MVRLVLMRSIISCSITCVLVLVLVVVLFGVTGAQAEDFRDKVLFIQPALALGTGDPKYFQLVHRQNLVDLGLPELREA